MRLWPRHWHVETAVCALRGHVAPALDVAWLEPHDRELGFDSADGRRLARCLRCDTWIEGFPPAEGTAEWQTMPSLSSIELPRRGDPLSDAIVLRLIAFDRAVHSVIFGFLAIALVVIDTKLFDLQSFASDAAKRLDGVASNTGPHGSHDLLSTELHRIADLKQSTITVLAATAAVYCIIEGIEAVGLWLERRWAEYLTAIATAGFLPFEVHELRVRVSVFRVGALVVNIAILVYLVYAKRLFGVRGGMDALQEEIDWDAVLAAPTPPEPEPPHPTPTRT